MLDVALFKGREILSKVGTLKGRAEEKFLPRGYTEHPQSLTEDKLAWVDLATSP